MNFLKRILHLEVVVDALITVLVTKKLLTRAEIQKEILDASTLKREG